MVVKIDEQKRKRMSREQINDNYKGKWVFLTNITDNPYSAIPAIIADSSYEDRKQGIYKEFNDSAKYGLTGHVSLLLSPDMAGFEVF